MPTDFKSLQIKTKQIIASGSDVDANVKLIVYPVDSQRKGAQANRGIIDSDAFDLTPLYAFDTFMYVSGAIGDRNSNNRSIAVFGGDVHSSGNVYANLSGSLTTLSDGTPWIVGSNNVFVSTNSIGQIEVSGVVSYGGLDGSYSPIGFWKFDGNLLDSSGNDNHLTNSVGTEQYADGLFGKRALFLNGKTSYNLFGTYENPNLSMFRTTSSLTIECVVNLLKPSSGLGIIAELSNDTVGQGIFWRLSIESFHYARYSYQRNTLSDFNNYALVSSASMLSSQWYHLTLTRENFGANEQIIKFFINGEKTDTMITDVIPNLNLGGNESVFVVGRGPILSTFSYFYGALQDLKIYNTVLSEEQIRQEALRSGFY